MNNANYGVTRKIDGLKKEELAQDLLPYFALTKTKRIGDGKEQRGTEIFDTYEGNFQGLERGIWKSEDYGDKVQMIIHFTTDSGEKETLKSNVSHVTRQLMNKLASVKEVGKLKLVLGMSIDEKTNKRYPWISVQVDGRKITKEEVAISKEDQEQYIEKEETKKGTNYYYDKLDDKLFELCKGIQPSESKFEATEKDDTPEMPREEQF